MLSFVVAMGSGDPVGELRHGMTSVDLSSGSSLDGHCKFSELLELVALLVASTFSAKAVLGVNTPTSQSLTRLRTLQKLGLGDLDFALALRLPADTLIPLFLLALLLAFAAPGLLVRLVTRGLFPPLGESVVGTVKFTDMVTTQLLVLQDYGTAINNGGLRIGLLIVFFFTLNLLVQVVPICDKFSWLPTMAVLGKSWDAA
jgi:hypothetical protein